MRYRTRISQSDIPAVSTLADIQSEIHVGRDVAARLLGQYKLYDNPSLNRYINLVGNAVAMHSGRPELEFHFAVLDSDVVNAYSAPGGYVFITRGTLGLMQNEAELAGVLGHEIAHVTQRHIVKELKIRGSDQDGGAGLTRLLGGAGDSARIAFAQGAEQAMEILLKNGLKKEDELEADRVGILLTALAGYDPPAYKEYLSRVSRLESAKTEVVHRTHPPFEQRLQALDEVINTSQLAQLHYPTMQQRFESQTCSLR